MKPVETQKSAVHVDDDGGGNLHGIHTGHYRTSSYEFIFDIECYVYKKKSLQLLQKKSVQQIPDTDPARKLPFTFTLYVVLYMNGDW